MLESQFPQPGIISQHILQLTLISPVYLMLRWIQLPAPIQYHPCPEDPSFGIGPPQERKSPTSGVPYPSSTPPTQSYTRPIHHRHHPAKKKSYISTAHAKTKNRASSISGDPATTEKAAMRSAYTHRQHHRPSPRSSTSSRGGHPHRAQ